MENAAHFYIISQLDYDYSYQTSPAQQEWWLQKCVIIEVQSKEHVLADNRVSPPTGSSRDY